MPSAMRLRAQIHSVSTLLPADKMLASKKNIFTGIIALTLVVLYIQFETMQNEIVNRITDHRKTILRSDALSELTTVTSDSLLINLRTKTYRPWVTSANKPGLFRMPDMQSYESELKPEKNIFFVMSTVIEDDIAKLTPRQSCAIESAARANSDWSVFVLFTSARMFSYQNSTNMVPLLFYSNIHFRRLNMETYAIGTPLEKFFRDNSLRNSLFIVEHTSDVLRLLTLYKYGGTYLDSDVVVMDSLNELPHNYLGSEGDGYIANGIINLQVTGYGHTVAEAFLNEIAENFNGSVWAANGPAMVTRVMRKFCNVTNVWDMTRERCGGKMSILPPDTFFQVTYPRHTWYFEEAHASEVMEKVAGHILTHLWNKLTGGIVLRKDSPVAYIILANVYCPNVINNCKEYF
ncbi:lactosylceramide 4-alpha-galactosyltransferase [Aedes aegypti]|uniref:Alpha 1,4-glycosyltransferase domain-containing protein n=1 Tax=Aedes aegypti TaxID=7159 RepID=A0A1S4F042_AEDAE|nr:lactosylceramide 4-alpha-galactosyltransferase [Aedes aegypti]